MQRISVSGAGEVATLLHRIAEGAGTGTIQLGADSYLCSPEISAVVEAGDTHPVSVLTIRLSGAGPAERRPGQVVEQELTHPGG